MDIKYEYTKKRSDFGRQPLFCEQGPELCDSIPPDTAEQKRYILRNPVNQLTQNTPNFSQHDINTIRAEYTTTGANHAEGGWPKDVNILDPEATQRYKRKIEKDDNYIHCVMSLNTGVEHYLNQNNAVDMYQIYYCELAELPPLERSSIRTVNVYSDETGCGKHRPVTSMSWQGGQGKRFAVTHLDVDFNRNPLPNSGLKCYVWDVENPNDPDMTIIPPSGLLDLQYNPRDKNLLAGGLVNGQVAWWDMRVKGKITSGTCAPHVAHRDIARSVFWINTKGGSEFFSGGPDGCCKWWDMRNMNEPTDEMIIDVVKSSFDVQTMVNANGITCLEYEPTLPTRFMCGTENGLVIGGNRKGKTPMEKLPLKYDAHLGPVMSLERNPGFLKNFLTVGHWEFSVWSEECRESPILWCAPQRHKVTAATWSPQRLSLLLSVQSDGKLGVWDLLRRQEKPVLTMQVCKEPLLRVKAHPEGSFVLCGSQKGNVYLAELSTNLSQSDKNDKSLLTAIFERESKRERILEARVREIRLKQRQAEEGSPVVSATNIDPTLGDKDLHTATQEYMAIVKKELAAMN